MARSVREAMVRDRVKGPTLDYEGDRFKINAFPTADSDTAMAERFPVGIDPEEVESITQAHVQAYRGREMPSAYIDYLTVRAIKDDQLKFTAEMSRATKIRVNEEIVAGFDITEAAADKVIALKEQLRSEIDKPTPDAVLVGQILNQIDLAEVETASSRLRETLAGLDPDDSLLLEQIATSRIENTSLYVTDFEAIAHELSNYVLDVAERAFRTGPPKQPSLGRSGEEESERNGFVEI